VGQGCVALGKIALAAVVITAHQAGNRVRLKEWRIHRLPIQTIINNKWDSAYLTLRQKRGAPT
jgi:hypothetical protein